MVLEERVDGIPVADGVDDCAGRIAQRDAAAGAAIPRRSFDPEPARPRTRFYRRGRSRRRRVVPAGTVASITSLVPAA